MTIVLEVVGGLALFMYGIRTLSSGMEKLSSGRLQIWLDRMINSPIKAAAFGTLATALIQSSSMLMVTMIGLINANLITLEQSISVMMGQEIGTTITAQIVSFKIGGFSYIFIVLGTILTQFVSNRKVNDYGQVVLGFGIISLGMNLMSGSLGQLTKLPLVINWLTLMEKNNFAGVFAGMVATAAVQSSSAVTALVVAMGISHSITLNGAIAIILGANIGTCVTGLIASLTLSRNSRRASIAQILINIIGVLLFLPFISPFAKLISYSSVYLARQIANAHTFFNVSISIVLFPFIKQLAWLTDRLIPKTIKTEKQPITQFIDTRQFRLPPIALSEATKEFLRIANTTSEMLDLSRDAFVEAELDSAKKVLKLESDFVDPICPILENFINVLMEGDLSIGQQKRCFQIKRLIIDLERVGDLTENLAQGAKRRVKDEVKLSDQAQKDLRRLFKHAQVMFRLALKALDTGESSIAQEACQREKEFDNMYMEARDRHMVRLEKGICTPEAHIIFLDAIRDLERICDHIDNVALSVLEV